MRPLRSRAVEQSRSPRRCGWRNPDQLNLMVSPAEDYGIFTQNPVVGDSEPTGVPGMVAESR